MNKLMTYFSVIFLSVGLSFPVQAQLGSLLPAASSTGGAPDGQVKSFIDDSDAINKLVFSSLKAMERAYATDEERVKINEEMKAFNAITDPKERQAKVAETLKSDSAKLEEMVKAKDISEKTKKLDKVRRQDLTSGTTNFLIAALRATALAATGSAIVSSVGSNPMHAIKVVPITAALPILSSAASTSASLMPQIFKIMQGANIKVPKVAANSKTQEVEF